MVLGCTGPKKNEHMLHVALGSENFIHLDAENIIKEAIKC